MAWMILHTHAYTIVLFQKVDNQRKPQFLKVGKTSEPLKWNESSSNIEASRRLKPGLLVGSWHQGRESDFVTGYASTICFTITFREILVHGYRFLLIRMWVSKRAYCSRRFTTPYFVTGLSTWLIEAMSDVYQYQRCATVMNW